MIPTICVSICTHLTACNDPNCLRSVEVNTRSKGMGRSFPAEDCKGFYVLRSPDQFLIHEQYEFERRKYAQDLISFDKEFSALFSDKPKTDDNEDGVTHEQFLQYVATALLPVHRQTSSDPYSFIPFSWHPLN